MALPKPALNQQVFLLLQLLRTVCANGCEYDRIQEAIIAASLGDTIDLASDTYTETVTFIKSIPLVGDGVRNTFLKAAGSSWEASTRVITVTLVVVSRSKV